MKFITGKHLSRRAFIGKMGAGVALPFLSAMVPAGRALAASSNASTPARLVCIEESMGCAGGSDWGMAEISLLLRAQASDFIIGNDSQLKPLQAYRDYLTVVSSTDCNMANPFNADQIGGDHDRSTAVFLTQAMPKQTQGSDMEIGVSIDQLHAQRFGQDTVLPSLELCIEEIDRGGGCAYNYHCAYTTSLAWASPSQPLPAIREPRAVFERLFGAGDSEQDRIQRRSTDKSMLDWMVSEVDRLSKSLGATDRVALDEYLQHIREVERRIQLMESRNVSGDEREMPEAPSGIPGTWEEHMQIMFDLQVLALQSDMTRAITFKTGFDQSNRTFPHSGTTKSIHGASHHGNVPDDILDFHKINTYRMGALGYFLDKMKNTIDGDGSLLDKTAIVWGSPMGDSNLHNHIRCPLLLMGHANGALQGNMHIAAAEGTPMANAFVSLMNGLGHELNSFGDSNGALDLSMSRAVTSTGAAV